MSDIKYLEQDKMTLECELETLEEYERKGHHEECKDDDYGGIRGAFTPLQIKFAKQYLRKRIAWFEAEIEKAEKEVA